ncbi:rod shape-determining protein [Sphingobium sp. SJ10-10]|uniref:rod shape-determining protein n=1 Tax=Sphingobium sp. SJ10-10 TaxID=3114999 RepID=UPI002E197BC9|nr:rod shape-determining protein [Sphingobium sp. SJ10-10]
MFSFSSWTRPELAIDFGTANLRVITRDSGVVFDEPSLCCFTDLATLPRLVAAGTAAQAMVDRTPRMLSVRRPLRRGVLQDIPTATELLRYAVPRELRRKPWRKARALIGVPADATQAERGALLTAATDAGLSPELVLEPLVAALGAGIRVDEPRGALVVDCGAGTTEVALISLGGICLTRSVRAGGAALDQAITDHLHFRHKILIGRQSAERIKKDYAALNVEARSDDGLIEVRGRSLVSMSPQSMQISSAEIGRVVKKHAMKIVKVVRDVLNETSPELSHDLYLNGILLTGGSAVVPRLPQMIEHETGLPVILAQDPSLCVAQGLHHILQG